MKTTLFLLCLVFLALISQPSFGEEFWNEFRGPTADGHSPSDKLPLNWSENKNVTWKTEISGKAWSSPVAWGNQIWVTNATPDGKKLFAVCLDAKSGKIIHNVTVFEIAKPMYCISYNSYASPTPAVEEGRVWVH